MWKTLVVGGGSIGERHIRSFQATRRAKMILCEIDDHRREELRDRYGLADTYSSHCEVPPDNFDVAVIATPAHLHLQQAVELAEKGSHLLIEKPLSVSLKGIDRLRDLIAAKHLTVGVAYNHRALPALQELKRWIAEGQIGKPVQLVAFLGSHFPTGRPSYREIYYNDHSTGGGAIQDVLTHLINVGEWVLGPIGMVNADADHLVLDGVDVEDTVHVFARHGQAMACYCLNQHQMPHEFTLTVVGDRGTARFDYAANQCKWMDKPNGDWHINNFGPLSRDDPYILQAESFLDSIENGTQPLCSLEEGVKTQCSIMTILDQAVKYKEHRVVKYS